MPVPRLPLHKTRHKLDLLSSNPPDGLCFKQKHYDKQRFVKKSLLLIKELLITLLIKQ